MTGSAFPFEEALIPSSDFLRGQYTLYESESLRVGESEKKIIFPRLSDSPTHQIPGSPALRLINIQDNEAFQ